MRLCRFTHSGGVRIGKVVGGHVVDLSGIPGVGTSMRAVLADLAALRPALEAARAPSFALDTVHLIAPIDDPQKYLAIGMNYKAHADEAAAAGISIPKFQLWFNKQVSCITGPYDPIDLPRASTKLDYEAEMGVVIGKRCRHVSVADARSVIAGYCVTNDVSARDWQLRTPTYTLGKSFDTHGPIGPWITTDDEIEDPHALMMWLTVNGEERQRTSTGDMIYNIYEQIAYLTTVMTLEPGDLIATGTPAGVGIATGSFLKPGDRVRVEIEHLGAIDNQVRAEP
ncbi:MAG: fumarylacetoacetate hydrolase family protein [Pseudomonadota bacterium]|nr:fumarylacetoacetate hydrolase family protein [Pseudomonadota bacterium]